MVAKVACVSSPFLLTPNSSEPRHGEVRGHSLAELPRIHKSGSLTSENSSSTHSAPVNRGKKEGRSDYASALENLCETYSLLRTYPEGEQSLLTPPVRIVVVRGVVGDRPLTPTVYADRVDLGVDPGSGVGVIGYALTGRRVGRVIVVRGVVGEWALAPTAHVDGVDLGVGSGPGEVGIGYALAVGGVVGVVVLRGVVGDVEPTPAAHVDGEDLSVGCGPLVALISDPLAGRRVGGIVVARGVVGDVALVPAVYVDGEDLGVVPVVS